MPFRVVGYLWPKGSTDWPGRAVALVKDGDGQYYASLQGGAPQQLQHDDVRQAIFAGAAIDCELNAAFRVGDFAHGPVEYRPDHKLFVVSLTISDAVGPAYYRDDTSLGAVLSPLAAKLFEEGLIAYRNDNVSVARDCWYRAGRAVSRVILPELATYASYFQSQDRDGLQAAAERIHALVSVWIPMGDISPARYGAARSVVEASLRADGQSVRARILDDKVLWKGPPGGARQLKSALPVQRWEAELLSSLLRLLSGKDDLVSRLLRRIGLTIQARIWFCRSAGSTDDMLKAWILLGFDRSLVLQFPPDWLIPDPPLRVTRDLLSPEPGHTLAFAAPLGRIAITRNELLLVRRQGLGLDDLHEMATALFRLRPWAIALRKQEALGGILGSLAQDLAHSAQPHVRAGDAELTVAVLCLRSLVDGSMLSARQLGDVARTAVLLSRLKRPRAAAQYAQRFVQEFTRRGLAALDLRGEDDRYSLPADAFRIYGHAQSILGEPEDAQRALKRAAELYDKTNRFHTRHIECLVALARLDPPGAEQYLTTASSLATDFGNPYYEARVALARYETLGDHTSLDSGIKWAEAATQERPEKVGGWLLWIRLLSEKELDFAAVHQRALDASLEDRSRFEFGYGVLLEALNPTAAARHWLQVLTSTQPQNIAIAERLAELLAGSPLIALIILERLPSPSPDAPLGLLWVWFRVEPDRVSPDLAEHMIKSDLGPAGAERLAQYFTDRASREPAESENRRRFVDLAKKLNNQLEIADPAFEQRHIWTRRIRISLLEGDVGEAATYLPALERQWPNDPYVSFYRAEVEQRRGNLAVATSLLEKLLIAHPRVEYLDRLYRIALWKGEMSRARAALERIVEEHSGDAPILVALGHLGIAEGNIDKAFNCYTEAVQCCADTFTEDGELDPHEDRALSRAIRSLIAPERFGVRHRSEISSLLCNEPPLILARFADELLMGQHFEPAWVEVLRPPLIVHFRARAARAVAQYLMGRAIAIQLGLVSDQSLQGWTTFAFELFADDDDLLAEFVAGAKGTYARLFRVLAREWAGAESPPRDPPLARVLNSPTKQVPASWRQLIEYVAGTAGEPAYYRESRRLFRLAGVRSVDEFNALVEEQIRQSTYKEVANIRKQLDVALKGERRDARLAAVEIFSGGIPARRLWKPDRIFNLGPEAQNGHLLPIWVDGEALQLSAATLFDVDLAHLADLPVKWEPHDMVSYGCVVNARRVANAAAADSVTSLLSRQVVRLSSEARQSVFGFSSDSASVLGV